MTRRNFVWLLLLFICFTATSISARADDSSTGAAPAAHSVKKKSHSHKKSKKSKKKKSKKKSSSGKSAKHKTHSPKLAPTTQMPAQEPGSPLPPAQVPKE